MIFRIGRMNICACGVVIVFLAVGIARETARIMGRGAVGICCRGSHELRLSINQATSSLGRQRCPKRYVALAMA
ncbi:hypothetical protein BJX96DRAFT_160249 [Aspergillus floccosus]